MTSKAATVQVCIHNELPILLPFVFVSSYTVAPTVKLRKVKTYYTKNLLAELPIGVCLIE